MSGLAQSVRGKSQEPKMLSAAAAEDREWAKKARRAKKQGFASRTESEALLREINAANNGG